MKTLVATLMCLSICVVSYAGCWDWERKLDKKYGRYFPMDVQEVQDYVWHCVLDDVERYQYYTAELQRLEDINRQELHQLKNVQDELELLNTHIENASGVLDCYGGN